MMMILTLNNNFRYYQHNDESAEIKEQKISEMAASLLYMGCMM